MNSWDRLTSIRSGETMRAEADAPVGLESILCTEELSRRSSRPPEHEKENRALSALVQALVDSPNSILQTLADTILEMLSCGSAGISLLTSDGGTKIGRASCRERVEMSV